MTAPVPDFPFAYRLPTDVAAQIRATAPAVPRSRRRRLAPMVWRFDHGSVR
jgi:hypothetical protein